MKIGRLILSNIASIHSAEIDFSSPLWVDEPIFIIHGETGSGKTTILDAICLALYKKTPRMQAGASDSYHDLTYGKQNMRSVSLLQYIRRGATCKDDIFVQLSFVGNDGKAYVSRLELPISRNNTLKTPVWTLTCDGLPITEEVDKAIIRAVGLDFDQFCRTTMLAQGDFTKFLKAAEKEKTAILEKITNTAIFSEIGERIAARVTQEETIHQGLSAQMEGLSAFLRTPEQQEAWQQEQAYLLTACAVRSILIRLTTEQEHWMEQAATHEKAVQQAEQTYLQARKAAEAPHLAAIKQQIADWERTESERRALLDLQEKQPQLRQAEQTLTLGEQALQPLQEKVATATQEQQQAAADMAEKQRAAQAFSTKALSDEKELLHQMEQVRTGYAQLEQQKKLTLEQGQKAEKAQAQLNESHAAAQQAKELADKMTDSITTFARSLRARLQAGDTCPICGQTIHSSLHDEEFMALYQPLKQAQDQAEQREKEAQQLYTTAEAARLAATQTQETLQHTYNQLCQTLQAISARTGLQAADYKQVDAPARLSAIDLQLTQAAEAQRIYTAAVARSQQAATALQTAQTALAKQQTANQAQVARIDLLRPAIRQDEQLLQQFYASPRALTPEQLHLLATIAPDHIAQQREALRTISEQFHQADGIYHNALQDRDACLAQRPVMADGDTLLSLRLRREQLEQRTLADRNQIAVLATHLRQAQDADQKAGLLKQQMEEHTTVLHNWQLLQKEFTPTKDGFSRIAQSYILRELLEQANHYLRRFSPRYELESQPGTFAILVRDCYCGGDIRPADMLSGGESFVVSLALALALSSLGNMAQTVDTLFIDEGFGTLDPDYLEQVISTLTTLHASTGRRIGIISHVALLRERIPMRISVQRVQGQAGISEITIDL